MPPPWPHRSCMCSSGTPVPAAAAAPAAAGPHGAGAALAYRLLLWTQSARMPSELPGAAAVDVANRLLVGAWGTAVPLERAAAATAAAASAAFAGGLRITRLSVSALLPARPPAAPLAGPPACVPLPTPVADCMACAAAAAVPGSSCACNTRTGGPPWCARRPWTASCGLGAPASCGPGAQASSSPPGTPLRARDSSMRALPPSPEQPSTGASCVGAVVACAWLACTWLACSSVAGAWLAGAWLACPSLASAWPVACRPAGSSAGSDAASDRSLVKMRAETPRASHIPAGGGGGSVNADIRRAAAADDCGAPAAGPTVLTPSPGSAVKGTCPSSYSGSGVGCTRPTEQPWGERVKECGVRFEGRKG
eukprot:356645-Chlamydomonas_euryale.AAC.3